MAILGTGSLGSLNSNLDVDKLGNISTVGVVVTGTWSGTITFQGSVDGTNFVNIGVLALSTGLFTNTINGNGSFLIGVPGHQTIRLKMTSYSSGSASIEIFPATSGALVTAQSTIVGATDAFKIGNVGDRLKVDASFSSATPNRVSPSFKGSAIRFDDMNSLNGGVDRGTQISSTTVYTQLYSYTGNGNLFSFTISFEGNLLGADPFNIKLEIDGITCFEINTLDLGTATYWSVNATGDENTMGLSLVSNTMRFSQKGGGLRYESSVKIYIKKAAGGAKRFRGGMVYLTKE